jgi:hypothetical protein
MDEPDWLLELVIVNILMYGASVVAIITGNKPGDQ